MQKILSTLLPQLQAIAVIFGNVLNKKFGIFFKITENFQQNNLSQNYFFRCQRKFNTQKKKRKKKALAKTQMMKKDEKGYHHHNRLVTSKEKLTCYIKERNPSIIIRQKMDRQIRIAARLTKERVQVSGFQSDMSHRRRSMMGHSFQQKSGSQLVRWVLC